MPEKLQKNKRNMNRRHCSFYTGFEQSLILLESDPFTHYSYTSPVLLVKIGYYEEQKVEIPHQQSLPVTVKSARAWSYAQSRRVDKKSASFAVIRKAGTMCNDWLDGVLVQADLFFLLQWYARDTVLALGSSAVWSLPLLTLARVYVFGKSAKSSRKLCMSKKLQSRNNWSTAVLESLRFSDFLRM